MHTPTHWTIRSSNQSDRENLPALLYTARWKHQHLDWINALDLLDETPFLLILDQKSPVGCLACPPDPPTVAWLRLFAVADGFTPSHLWSQLWPKAAVQAVFAGAKQAAALLSDDWFAPLLLESGFEHTNDVIFLEWCGETPPPASLSQGLIRNMRVEDLPAVNEVDKRAFNLIWQLSLGTLHVAFHQAALATVVEIDDQPVAYQISTASAFGAHLARLAVAPEWQRRGLGKALVLDLLRRFSRQGIHRVSVNTQTDNKRSLLMYSGLGFQQTGSRHPVYQRDLNA